MKINIITSFFLTAFLFSACNKVLDYSPKGVVTLDQLTTPAEADKLGIAAYASLGNDFGGTQPVSSMWLYGAVRSDDAYKGGGGVTDGGGGQGGPRQPGPTLG